MLWNFQFCISLFVFGDSVAYCFSLKVHLNSAYAILLLGSISSASVDQSFFPEHVVGRQNVPLCFPPARYNWNHPPRQNTRVVLLLLSLLNSFKYLCSLKSYIWYLPSFTEFPFMHLPKLLLSDGCNWHDALWIHKMLPYIHMSLIDIFD